MQRDTIHAIQDSGADDAAAAPLLEAYQRLLLEYLRDGNETALSAGYEMARVALKDGHGVVEMTNVHHRALQRLCIQGRISSELLHRAGVFLAECLSPFEMSLHGAREGTRALHHLNEVLEAELKRVAHALHDEAGQLLAVAHITLAKAAGSLPPEAHQYCGEIQQLLRQIEAGLRSLSHELRPTVLDNLGLLPALDFLADKVSQRTGLAVSVEGGPERRLPPPVETALYRIAQEALNNAARHARASRVTIRVECKPASVTCRIRDDGLSFTPGGESLPGLVLLGIRERLNALGGTLRVVAEPGCGTTILTDIPLGGC